MKDAQPNILIVDDDQGIRDLLGRFLTQHGYQTRLAKDGKQMQVLLDEQPADMIILDIMMPGEDGLTLCRKLRGTSNTPIIMLTAISEEVERILGLEMGADDYINKPFNPRELLARIKAILRRSQQSEPPCVPCHVEAKIFHFAGWKLYRPERKLLSPDQLEISLSSGEFDLLVALLEHPQEVLSRDRLLDLTKNREAAPFDRSVDIQISRLRHKIEEDQKSPNIIKTVRGGGYLLAVPVERES